jgi:hypothetical protein
MQRSADTSPYYPAWVATSEADLARGERALADRDLAALGAVMEHSCFKMHSCMLATVPPLMYWNGTTLAAIQEVWEARRQGLEGYVTSDAGPPRQGPVPPRGRRRARRPPRRRARRARRRHPRPRPRRRRGAAPMTLSQTTCLMGHAPSDMSNTTSLIGNAPADMSQTTCLMGNDPADMSQTTCLTGHALSDLSPATRPGGRS